MFVRDLIEARGEVRHLLARNSDTGSSAVTTESEQMLAGLRQRAVQIEFRNRSARALALLPRQGDEHSWPTEFFDESRGHDPDDARMPRIIGEHDREHLVEIHRQNAFTRLLEGLMIDLLPALVELLELTRNHVRFVLVAGQQQLDAADGVSHTPCGIKSRRENETNSSRG